MKEAPLVSVIIPTYNDSEIVCEAIDCSLNQTYQNIEIIVVDDGSTDGTERVVKGKYKNKICYVRQENKGLAGARNTGIKQASGKYLQFLDADDLIDHDKISIQVKVLQGVSKKALAYCDWIRCDMKDLTITYKRVSPLLQKEKPYDDILMKWETDLSIPVHCFMFDSVFFREYGIGFDESLPNHEDWECWMNVFALGPEVIFVDKALAYYRIRSSGMCRNKMVMREGYLSAINKQIRKNKLNRELVEKLKVRKKQIRYIYRDVSPLGRVIERCHPAVKTMYTEIVPWRIQRLFD